MPNSRGPAISAYNAAFSKGAKIYGDNIQSGTITSAHIASGTVVAADVAAGSITSAKIGTGAVTSIKLGAASVISAKIGTGAVLAAALAAGAVISAKIGAAAVTSAALGNDAVKLTKMFANQITGVIISSGITYAVAHGLGVTPSLVLVGLRSTKALISGGANVGESTASARTATNIYLVGKPHAIGYVAYVQV